MLERFPAKWIPVRVKKTRQNKRLELRSDSIGTEKALGLPESRRTTMSATPERLENTVDPKLLEILVCPLTKGPLEYDASRQELISRAAKLAYPIRDGIPIMLPEEARKIE
jgi:uncharacterized protein YbaR (Trm112 family)